MTPTEARALLDQARKVALALLAAANHLEREQS